MRRVILNFHGIGEPARALEAGEAAYWVSPGIFADTISLAVSLADRVETGFTFDDGNASDLAIAAPRLTEAKIPAVFFPLAARLGQPGSLNSASLKELVAMGHRIGSHGADHADWTALDTDGQRREWTWARDQIAEAVGAPVTEAAIPFGRYNAKVLGDLRAAGFARIYSSDGGSWSPGDWPVPRTSPRADMTLADIEAVLLGRESPFRRLRRKVARVVKARR